MSPNPYDHDEPSEEEIARMEETGTFTRGELREAEKLEGYPDTVIPKPGPSISGVTLTEEQDDALRDILDWTRSGLPEFSLGGYAGTGKTTMLREVVERLSERGTVKVLAPTGKAAQVLRRKGVEAETVHSFLYNFRGISRDEHTGRDLLNFEAKRGLDERPSWIVVDEASMVNAHMARDARQHGIPILWIGDHGQLPPIGEDPKILADPDAVLETIHRQAAGNPIIAAANKVRQGLEPRRWVQDVDERRAQGEDGEGELLVQRRRGGDSGALVRLAKKLEVDQVICGRNRTRHALNRIWRELDGRQFETRPEAGDRVICLKNNRRLGIFNGETFTIERIVDFWDGGDLARSVLVVDLKSEDGRLFETLPVWSGQFLGDRKLTTDEAEELALQWMAQLGDIDRIGIEAFDYGYAITCHKSQGSEWPRVLVVDEAFGEKPRWRYTAITRARDFCAIAI